MFLVRAVMADRSPPSSLTRIRNGEGQLNVSTVTTELRAGKFLSASALFWLVVAFCGQWAFFYYIADFYGTSILAGDFAAWSKNTLLRRGYVAGDVTGNLMFAAHALLAALVVFGGVLQMVPAIRSRAPRVHRWNGRVFLVAAMATSLGGLYLTWLRGGGPSNLYNALAITGNAALILAFAVLAWRAALARNIAVHRRWALRAYVAALGVWFFRVGLFAWIILNQGPVGITKALDGPFDRFWAVACYLLPLAILELYLRARDAAPRRLQLIAAATLIAFTLVMGIGTVGVSLFLLRFL
jgi:hypothetical protein